MRTLAGIIVVWLVGVSQGGDRREHRMKPGEPGCKPRTLRSESSVFAHTAAPRFLFVAHR